MLNNTETWHKIIIGNCEDMSEIPDESIHLMVTSPPYYNAPFDYPGLFKSYDDFLGLMKNVAGELKRTMAPGRIMAFVTDDMLVKGEKYPIVADIMKIFIEKGFRYRDRIVWRKPEGYIRISRRSGVVLQHPYPMYYYPDNLQESIILFQKGEFNYQKYMNSLDAKIIENSKIDLEEYKKNKWYLNVWDITNVLPLEGRIEQGIAAFPDEIPYRLIKLFSFVGETVLDPFLGSGTTTKMARDLGRNSIGYEIDLELVDVIKKKLGYEQTRLKENAKIDFIIKEDAKKLRSFLNEKVKGQKSVTRRSNLIKSNQEDKVDETSLIPKQGMTPLKLEEKQYPNYKSAWETRLEWINENTKKLVSQIIKRIEGDLYEVSCVPKNRWCYFYKGSSTRPESLFAVLNVTKQRVHVRIQVDQSGFIDKSNRVKLYKNWFFKRGQEMDFPIDSPEELDYALELIRHSYNNVN